MFQNERTSRLWLPLVASHLTRLQLKVMDFSVAIVVVFVLLTDNMIRNIMLPQLPTDSTGEELPWPTETFWESYLERAVVSARPCESAMGFFLRGCRAVFHCMATVEWLGGTNTISMFPKQSLLYRFWRISLTCLS